MLGLSSYSYTWACGVPGSLPVAPLRPIDLLHRTHGADIPVVQIADNAPLTGLSEQELEHFVATAWSTGVLVEVGMRGIASDLIRANLRIAQHLGSPVVRLVIDSPHHHPTWDEALEALRSHRDAFRAAGVVLAIENHDAMPVADLRRLVETLGDEWAGVCLDTVNSFGSLEGVEHVIETLAPLTVNLHLKDFEVRRVPHMMGFVVEGKPAGQGQLDIPGLLSTLNQLGRSYNSILELWTPPAAEIESTVAREAEWVRESLEYLRPIFGLAARDQTAVIPPSMTKKAPVA